MSETSARLLIYNRCVSVLSTMPYAAHVVVPDEPFEPQDVGDMAPQAVGGVYVQLVFQGLGAPISLGTAPPLQTWEWRELMTAVIRSGASLDAEVPGRMPGQTVSEFWDALLIGLAGLEFMTGDGDVVSFDTPYLGIEANSEGEFRKDLQVSIERQGTITRAQL